MKKLIIACLFAFSVNAQAEFISGNKLYSFLTGSNEVEKALGYGYVAGVFDLGYGTTHCAPETVTLKQVSDMTVKFLEKTPEHREKSGDQFITAIASTTWPCKNKSNSRGRQT